MLLGFIILSFNAFSQSNAVTYPEKIKEIEEERIRVQKLYLSADSITKDSIISESRKYLIITLKNEILPAWYGTPWSYGGMTKLPGKGSIACGYFITNVLCDIGYKIPRIKWAQSASETFINILSEYNVKRFRKKSLEELKKYIVLLGEGIYLIGLDNHVGFIIYSNNQINFTHSNYYNPSVGVMSQDLFSLSPLTNSSYRVIGKLFSNQMVENWIMGHEY